MLIRAHLVDRMVRTTRAQPAVDCRTAPVGVWGALQWNAHVEKPIGLAATSDSVARSGEIRVEATREGVHSTFQSDIVMHTAQAEKQRDEPPRSRNEPT